jgi:DNA-binding IclR family transcriptional regulator
LGKDPSVDLEKLKELVRQAKNNGYSSAKGERVEGVIGFSAPIIGYQNIFLGGVGLYLPDARYKPENRQKYIDTVKACAKEISSIVNPGYDQR